MRPITIDAVTRIPREHLDNPLHLIQDLVLENGSWHAGMASTGKTSVPRYFALAQEDRISDEVTVPRAADVVRYLKRGLVGEVSVYSELLDRSWWPRVWLGDGDPELGPHAQIPYDQKPAWQAISASPEWPWGRILALKCGAGKTVLALKLARLRSVRTLVVCHTLNMTRTWSEMAAADWCLDYPREFHGSIGDGTVDWENRDLVFSSMPGLLCRQYPPEFWSRWGLVIFDEGDLLGASHLQKMLPLFLGERLLVTATVSRRDKNDSLYRMHVGEVCFEDTIQDLVPECLIVDSPVPRMVQVMSPRTGKETYVSSEQMAWSPYLKRLAPNIPKTITFIKNNCLSRQGWCLKVVKDLLDQDRKILFLGERVAGLQDFNARAQELWSEYSSGLVLGASHMSLEECEKNLEQCNIIWAIQQIAKRGLNQPDVDTVVIEYASFKDPNRLQQTVGRCLRYYEGKMSPQVLVLNDANVPCLDDKAQYMSSWFQRQGYKVSWFKYEEN